MSASTQNQALAAVLFLYREVLGQELGAFEGLVRARRPEGLPVVLTREEVAAVLDQLHGTAWLVAALLYAAGLRLRECLELRVKDIDFGRNQIIVRRGKGQKDRVTTLPEPVKARLRDHLAAVRRVHEQDLARGYGKVVLPEALARKYPPPSGRGSGCFRRRGSARTRGGVRRLAFIYMNRRFSGRSRRLSTERALSSRPARTPCATHLPRICWRTAMTFGRSRNSWGTPM